MNIRKLIAIAVSILVNGLAFAWFNAWSSAAVAGAMPPSQPVEQVITLPAITVRPSAEQLRELRRERAAVAAPRQADAGGDGAVVMPYYSFAKESSVGVKG